VGRRGRRVSYRDDATVRDAFPPRTTHRSLRSACRPLARRAPSWAVDNATLRDATRRLAQTYHPTLDCLTPLPSVVCNCILRVMSRQDESYLATHEWMFGELGRHAAETALLARTVMAPGFVLPRIRLAPVAPYGHCLALAVPGEGDHYRHGIWVFLHPKFHGHGEQQRASVDSSVLHELLHHELFQAGRNPHHREPPWAERVQAISRMLGYDIKAEHPRSVRYARKVRTETPPGCLSYDELSRWPRTVARAHGGPSLRERLTILALRTKAPASV
jgi:hypothetical protein